MTRRIVTSMPVWMRLTLVFSRGFMIWGILALMSTLASFSGIFRHINLLLRYPRSFLYTGVRFLSLVWDDLGTGGRRIDFHFLSLESISLALCRRESSWFRRFLECPSRIPIFSGRFLRLDTCCSLFLIFILFLRRLRINNYSGVNWVGLLGWSGIPVLTCNRLSHVTFGFAFLYRRRQKSRFYFWRFKIKRWTITGSLVVLSLTYTLSLIRGGGSHFVGNSFLHPVG
ncbi:hypothetical protein F4814DRAFT_395887 [Daldinia grandis]|nr:hypothetical protein F4814DRAFT_395887 [Daldinia grandis]